jgi:hypothetical protein
VLLAVPGPAPAWTRIDTSNDVDEKAVVAFIDAYRGIDHTNLLRG